MISNEIRNMLGLRDTEKRLYVINSDQVTAEEYEYCQILHNVLWGEKGLVETLGPTWNMVHDPRFESLERKFIIERPAVFGGDARLGKQYVDGESLMSHSMVELESYAEILGEGRHFHEAVKLGGLNPREFYSQPEATGASIYTEGSNLEVRYSDVEGADVWPGEGNVNFDPQFQSDGYHLELTSMLLNRGATITVINGESYHCPAYDIDGDDRPFENTQPEIGVDELQLVSIDEPISTNNFSINLYPNPADQMVTISAKNGAVLIEANIYNNLGQNVYTGILVDNTLDISKLQPGIYIVELMTDQGKMREKLIVE